MPGTTALGLQYPLATETFQASRDTMEASWKTADTLIGNRSLSTHTHSDLSTLTAQQAYQNDVDAQRWMQVAP